MFPERLDAPQAYDIAKAMMDGFNRHYRLFRAESARAKHRFETADWHGQQRAQRERIEFYDLRVKECVRRLDKEFNAGAQPMDLWHQVKLHYIGLMVNHLRPELAETFFNSVTTKILHRTHFHNDFIFVRPAVSTEYIESDDPMARPTYRAYYPAPGGLSAVVSSLVEDFALQRPFEDLRRDVACVARAIEQRLGAAKLRSNFQIQVLSSLFFRNKGAYVVGKVINGFNELPFALPLLHGERGGLVIDAALFGENDLQMLFSFARDGMLPGSKTLAQLSSAHVPSAALIVCGVVPGLIAVGGYFLTNALAVVISFAVAGIYLAFQMVVLAALFARLRGWRPSGPFNLGAWGVPVTVAGLAYGVGALINLAWPRMPDTNWYENYAVILTSAVVLGTGLILMPFMRSAATKPAAVVN